MTQGIPVELVELPVENRLADLVVVEATGLIPAARDDADVDGELDESRLDPSP